MTRSEESIILMTPYRLPYHEYRFFAQFWRTPCHEFHFYRKTKKGAGTISSACSFLLEVPYFLAARAATWSLQFIQLRSHLFIFRLHLVIFLFQVLNLVRHFHFGITGINVTASQLHRNSCIEHVPVISHGPAETHHRSFVRPIEETYRRSAGVTIIAEACRDVPLVMGIKIQRMEGCQCCRTRTYFVNPGAQFSYLLPMLYMFCVLFCTSFFTAWSWLPLTASVEVALISPAATWVIFCCLRQCRLWSQTSRPGWPVLCCPSSYHRS